MSQPQESASESWRLPFGFHLENVYGGAPRKRQPSKLSIGKRAKAIRRAKEKQERCTLEELNAILWPSGKRMPTRPS